MSIDFEVIKEALSTIGLTINLLKQTRNLLPDGPKKQEIDYAIENTEKQLENAEIQIAQALGHRICHNHWPSGIMTSSDDKYWICPICKNEFVPKSPGTHPLAGRNKYRK